MRKSAAESERKYKSLKMERQKDKSRREEIKLE